MLHKKIVLIAGLASSLLSGVAFAQERTFVCRAVTYRR